LADGTTRLRPRLSRRPPSAAMEPVLGGRDDLAIWQTHMGIIVGPQWSPSLADGTTKRGRTQHTRRTGRNGARPWRTGRRPWPHNPHAGTTRCRNGARPWRTGRRFAYDAAKLAGNQPQWSRPWRTGRPGARAAAGGAIYEPQWSPSLADGTTCGIMGGVSKEQPAAMEPVLGGRDDLPAGESRSCTYAAAMEPVLGGRDDPTRQSGGCASAGSRNGARPWRTGRRIVCGAGSTKRRRPQWSPSLADGTTRAEPGFRVDLERPQWSPSLADGTTELPAPRAGRKERPQWSPSLADGTTWWSDL